MERSATKRRTIGSHDVEAQKSSGKNYHYEVWDGGFNFRQRGRISVCLLVALCWVGVHRPIVGGEGWA